MPIRRRQHQFDQVGSHRIIRPRGLLICQGVPVLVLQQNLRPTHSLEADSLPLRLYHLDDLQPGNSLGPFPGLTILRLRCTFAQFCGFLGHPLCHQALLQQIARQQRQVNQHLHPSSP